MIEKLKKQNTWGECLEKLNEVIDVVNQLVMDVVDDSDWYDGQTRPENVQSDAESRPENVQDKFAEQRKWIGKLCRLWDGDEQMSHLRYGILYTITPTSPLPFCCSVGDGKTFDFEHCEPVLPDDNIIYKKD